MIEILSYKTIDFVEKWQSEAYLESENSRIVSHYLSLMGDRAIRA